MIAWRVHNYDCKEGDWLEAPVYAFIKKKIALWYREKYRKGYGKIIKVYGYRGKKDKDHPDQRIFNRAIILEIKRGR